jgi:Holliday junction resolvase
MAAKPKANSRNKGAGFERDIASELFLLTGIKFSRDLEQVRDAGRGDLVADDPQWPFTIECKRRASGSLPSWDWIEQASTAAECAGKIPAVVFRFDRQRTRVMVPFLAFQAAYGIPSDDLGQWAEVTLPGLAELACEIMAASVVYGPDSDAVGVPFRGVIS